MSVDAYQKSDIFFNIDSINQLFSDPQKLNPEYLKDLISRTIEIYRDLFHPTQEAIIALRKELAKPAKKIKGFEMFYLEIVKVQYQSLFNHFNEIIKTLCGIIISDIIRKNANPDMVRGGGAKKKLFLCALLFISLTYANNPLESTREVTELDSPESYMNYLEKLTPTQGKEAHKSHISKASASIKQMFTSGEIVIPYDKLNIMGVYIGHSLTQRALKSQLEPFLNDLNKVYDNLWKTIVDACKSTDKEVNSVGPDLQLINTIEALHQIIVARANTESLPSQTLLDVSRDVGEELGSTLTGIPTEIARGIYTGVFGATPVGTQVEKNPDVASDVVSAYIKNSVDQLIDKSHQDDVQILNEFQTDYDCRLFPKVKYTFLNDGDTYGVKFTYGRPNIEFLRDKLKLIIAKIDYAKTTTYASEYENLLDQCRIKAVLLLKLFNYGRMLATPIDDESNVQGLIAHMLELQDQYRIIVLGLGDPLSSRRQQTQSIIDANREVSEIETSKTTAAATDIYNRYTAPAKAIGSKIVGDIGEGTRYVVDSAKYAIADPIISLLYQLLPIVGIASIMVISVLYVYYNRRTEVRHVFPQVMAGHQPQPAIEGVQPVAAIQDAPRGGNKKKTTRRIYKKSNKKSNKKIYKKNKSFVKRK
jgi:hypothetical protein